MPGQVNDFGFPIATDPGALVAAQADYQSWTQRAKGFASGIVKGIYLNKALRQSSYITAVLTEVVRRQQTDNFLDDPTQFSHHVDMLTAALQNVAVGAAPGRLLGNNIIRAVGQGTYTFGPKTNFIRLICIGAGAGGSNCNSTSTTGSYSGGGGGAGGFGWGEYYVTPGTFCGCNVGAGGGPQIAGGLTSFATLMTSMGGATSNFGSNAQISPGGQGGLVYGANLLACRGNYGGDGQSGSVAFSGYGGASVFGGQARAAASNGISGGAPGAGGGGAYGGVYVGGSGADGLIIVSEYAV